MKIAIVFGKGLDGCGVEKYGYEWKRYDPDNIDIFNLVERSFVRSGGHIKESISFKPSEMLDVAKRLNDNYDIVILNSYPSPMHKRETIKSFYYDLVLQIKKPILVSMMHEIKRMNYDRIPIHLAISNAADIIFNFSTETTYSQDMAGILTNKKLGERIARMKLPITVSDYEEYRIPFKDKNKSCIYASRWTSMKHPSRLIDLWEMDKDFHYAIHGIERSIGAKFDIIDRTEYQAKFNGYTYYAGRELMESFGPYEYQEGMNLIANSMFGYSGYALPKERHNYGDRFEYAQMEIIAVGTVPIFDIDYGLYNNAENGKAFSDHDIAIWSDRNDLENTKEQIHRISKDESAYNRYLDAGIEFLKIETDASNIIPPMLEHITKVGKQTDKWDHDTFLDNVYNTDVKEHFNYVMENHIPALGAKEVMNQTISYFEKKKRIVYKSKQELKDDGQISLEDFFT